MAVRIEEYEQVWEIWADAKDKLYRYLLAKFKDKELADNVSQDIILKMHKSCCNGTEINNLNAWLYQIAHNAGIDYLKKEQKLKQSTPVEISDETIEVWDRLSEFLLPMIDFLADEYATPLKMADIDGISQQAIADKLGLSLTATKSRIQRARNKLREEITTCCHLEFNEKGNLVDIEIKDSCTPLKDFKK